MIVTSFQDFKLLGKQICSTFSYFLTSKVPLYHFLANLLAHNKKTAAWLDRRLVGSVGRASVCCAGGRGFEPQTGPTLRVLK